MALSKVWVYAEAVGGMPTSATLELLTKARELGTTVEAFYAGPDADAAGGAAGRARRHDVASPSSPATPSPARPWPPRRWPPLVGRALARSRAVRPVLRRARRHAPTCRCASTANVVTNATDLSLDGDAVVVGTAIFGGNTLVDTVFTGAGPSWR